jgi:hypothetical protein
MSSRRVFTYAPWTRTKNFWAQQNFDGSTFWGGEVVTDNRKKIIRIPTIDGYNMNVVKS